MTLSITKGLALCGVCALLAGLGTAASAQGYGDGAYRPHHPIRRAHRAILRQKAAYAHDVRTGHYGAAEQAHLRAAALRHRIRRVRDRRMMNQDNGGGYQRGQGDNPNRGYGQGNNRDNGFGQGNNRDNGFGQRNNPNR